MPVSAMPCALVVIVATTLPISEALSDSGPDSLVTVNTAPGSGFSVSLSVLTIRMRPEIRALVKVAVEVTPATTATF